MTEPTITCEIGVYISAGRDGLTPGLSGKHAAVVAVNGRYFTVDFDGTVGGDPAAVEKEAALSLFGGDYEGAARGIIGLARLAIRSAGST